MVEQFQSYLENAVSEKESRMIKFKDSHSKNMHFPNCLVGPGLKKMRQNGVKKSSQASKLR